MKISKSTYQELKSYCLDQYPKQSCGIIVSDGEKLCQHIPMKNSGAWPYGFQFDPFEQMKVMKNISKQNLKIGVIYHVHLTSKAYPTSKDVLRHYYEDILCGVVSLLNNFDFKIFKLFEGKIYSETLQIIDFDK